MGERNRMKALFRAIGAIVVCLSPRETLAEFSYEYKPVKVIFDTDMGNDVDDALALAMIHALQSRGECELLAVTITKDHPLAAAFVDGVNRFYGRGEIPVGLVHSGPTPDVGKFIQLASALDGEELRFPNRYASGDLIPDAKNVLRGALANETDGSVVVIQVGFSTNLARLLESPADAHSPLNGRDLVAQKVKQLYVMAGHFEQANSQQEGIKEYNVVKDISSTQKLVENWPTPIDFSGFEIGRDIEYPAESIELDYGYLKHHPVAEAYRLYMPSPHNRPTWDLTPVLQAVRPTRGYFGISPQGRVSVDNEGVTHFEEGKQGLHRYFTVTPEQIVRAKEAFVCLASQPPEPVKQ